MALHTELPIYRTGVRLLDLAVKAQIQMPRTVKRALGEKITQHCVEMLDLMALANATQRDVRAGHIDQLLTRQRAMTVLLRVSHDARYISPKLWADSIELLGSIGKQAGGLMTALPCSSAWTSAAKTWPQPTSGWLNTRSSPAWTEPHFAPTGAFGYTACVPSKKGGIGIGVSNVAAAQSRNLRRSCGFHLSGLRFGGPNVGPQGRRNTASAAAPVRQPVRAASLIGVEVAVSQLAALEAFMPQLPTMGVPAPALTVVDGIPTTTSADLASYFGKRHDDVLKGIRNLLQQLPESTARNFAASEYTDSTGRKLPCYLITRDGFTLLAMGFTGKRALQFKLAYIDAFNRMEQALQAKPHTAPHIDVRAVLLSGQSNPVALPAELERAIEERAWALSHEAYALLREHMRRRVADRHISGHPTRTLHTKAAMADIKTITLGHALAHSAIAVTQANLNIARTAAYCASNSVAKLEAELANLTKG